MNALKSAARFGLHGLGLLGAVRNMRAGGLRIMCYHRFPSAERWDEQCRHIREFYHPVSLTQVDAAMRGGAPLPSKAVALTVDDGYRDFYTTAFPIARKYSVPMTQFVVTDFLDGKCWLWWDAVRYALERTEKVTALPFVQGPLDSPAARRRAARRVTESMKIVPDAQRRSSVAQLLEICDVAFPAQPPEQYAAVSWDEVREMAGQGMEFGAHTATHPILTQVESLAREIDGPKQRLEEELRRPANYFCYPNGDFDARVIECVKQAGYTSGYTTKWGRNLAPTSPLLLERTPADPDWPFDFFKEVLAFGYPWRRPQTEPAAPAALQTNLNMEQT